jgi:hypothetical protein
MERASNSGAAPVLSRHTDSRRDGTEHASVVKLWRLAHRTHVGEPSMARSHAARSRIAFLSVTLTGLTISSCPRQERADVTRNVPTAGLFIACGDEAESCCGPYRDQYGPFGVPHCNARLGCSLVTKKCEQPCGHAGEVCCDRPDTRGFQGATRSSQSTRFYNEGDGNVSATRPMCAESACDMTTRRCVADCGANAGQPCCGPEPYSAVARCTKPTLVCRFAPDSYVQGICEPCGALWQTPCDIGEPCREGTERPDSSMCEPCGGVGQLPCARGGVATCRPGLVMRIPGGRCNRPPPPPSSPTPGLSVGVGAPSGPLCPPGTILCGARCVASDPLNCGRCGSSCPQGTICEGQRCVADTTCAAVSAACVPATQPGTHCCSTGADGAPLTCNFGRCVPCIRTGELCPDFQPLQICCDRGPGFNYTCVLDTNSGEAICGVPDP